jgi:hypothetical protein
VSAEHRSQGPFLIDVFVPGLDAAGAARMVDALQHAAARLTAGGTDISWRGALYLPGQSRCMALLDADSASVAQDVGDIAGLSAAAVHRVELLGVRDPASRPGS